MLMLMPPERLSRFASRTAKLALTDDDDDHDDDDDLTWRCPTASPASECSACLRGQSADQMSTHFPRIQRALCLNQGLSNIILCCDLYAGALRAGPRLFLEAPEVCTEAGTTRSKPDH
jgi:hypothetical protein